MAGYPQIPQPEVSDATYDFYLINQANPIGLGKRLNRYNGNVILFIKSCVLLFSK